VKKRKGDLVNIQLGKYRGLGIKRPYIADSADQMDSKYLINESATIINTMMQRILSNSKIELNVEDVQKMKNRIFDDFRKELKQNNGNLEMYLQYTGKTENQLMKECEDEATQHLSEKAVIEKVAELENISIDSEDKQHKLYQKVILFLLQENTADA